MGVCEYSTQLSPYLDGELDADQRMVVEGHVRNCVACEVELRELRGLSRIFAAATGPFLSFKALARLHGHISEVEDEQEQADRTARGVLRITRVLTGIAACLLVAGSLWLSRSRQQSPAESPTRVAEVPSTPAPWDLVAQPTPEVAPAAPSDSVSPADDTGNWMLGGLVSSASLTGTASPGESEEP